MLHYRLSAKITMCNRCLRRTPIYHHFAFVRLWVQIAGNHHLLNILEDHAERSSSCGALQRHGAKGVRQHEWTVLKLERLPSGWPLTTRTIARVALLLTSNATSLSRCWPILLGR